MKIWTLLRVASAAVFFATAAHAQNAGTVTQHAFAIGRGAGQTGFVSLLCGSAQLAVGQSAAAPICRTISGDVTLAASGAVTIANNAVSDAKLRDSGALSVIGRSANSAGDPADISCTAASGGVLRESGSTLGCGTIATAGIANDAVTDAKLRDGAALSVIGRAGNTSGDPADIAAASDHQILRRSGTTIGFGSINLAQSGAVGSSILPVANGGTNSASASGTALDNITGFSSNGILTRTAAGTYAFRTLAGPAAGISVSNGNGVAGNPTLALANDLAAVEGLATNGCAARTATDTWAVRTITGTANQITVSNGDCVAGNPTISIPASPSFSGTVAITEAMTLGGDISPSQLVANTNDWAPTGFATASAIRLSTDASRNITGLAGGSDGRIIILHNVGAQNAVLINQDAASTAANRFLFGGDVTLLADYSITLRYDGTTQRWRAITTASAGGGGGVTSVTVAAGTGIAVSGTCTITTSGTCTVAASLSSLTSSLGANVALSNVSNYFDGPSTAQGTSGTWLATGTVTVIDVNGPAQIHCKLWDGTTVMAATAVTQSAANFPAPMPLSGAITSPAGNIRISCKDISSTGGAILANQTASGNKDSTLTVVRIQ